MAENHYVDPGDQHIAAEGVEDHSELTTHYAEAKRVELGPWMQETERQAAMQAERQAVVRGLRKYSFLIGLYVSLPVILAIIIVQIAMTKVAQIQGGDNSIVMAYVFLIVFALGALLGLSYALFKWIGQTFYNHNLRALPITLSILIALSFLIQDIFEFTDNAIGGLAGYGAALISLAAVSVALSVVSIFLWTGDKTPAGVKLGLPLFIAGGTAALHFLV